MCSGKVPAEERQDTSLTISRRGIKLHEWKGDEVGGTSFKNHKRASSNVPSVANYFNKKSKTTEFELNRKIPENTTIVPDSEVPNKDDTLEDNTESVIQIESTQSSSSDALTQSTASQLSAKKEIL